jgi:hypothetical protein
MPSTAICYSERYCAFIDILGFGSLIAESSAGGVPVADIHRALSAVHAPPNTILPAEADLRHQNISDAIALSAAANGAGFDAICSAAEELSRRLLRSGYFARGGITKGLLYHDNHMVFGPALVEAYRLEKEIAKYPRIVVPRPVAADGPIYSKQGTHWKKHFADRFIQAKDGPFFLHVLRYYIEDGRKNQSILSILRATRTTILGKLEKASDNPDHFQKVAWFVNYWNDHIRLGIEGLDPIEPRPL